MTSFACTIFFGAFLLFQIQPLIGKYILPWFGGGPGVWTTCMVFFQIVLVGGYAYAHLLTKFFTPRYQATIHLILVAAALLLLPITPAEHWKPTSPDRPELRILTLLLVSLGLPYFLLSTTGPLMQAWFGLVRPGVSPYRLYALSNFGSLLALLSYPLVFERWFSRSAQAALWGWGLGLFALSAAACAWKLFTTQRLLQSPTDGPSDAAAVPVTPITRFLWVALSACASILLLAVTNTMCLDVAVVPFLWILPLSLYLLSFILCFDAPRWYSRERYLYALVVAIGALCLAQFFGFRLTLWLQIGLYSGALFVCCMVCHGELYRLKPPQRSLTSFYLAIGVGGALGGLFVALAAPAFFKSYAELRWGVWLLCVLLALIFYRFSSSMQLGRLRIPRWSLWAVGSVGLGIALMMEPAHAGTRVVSKARNFYGVLSVREEFIPESLIWVRGLFHGSTMHGLQVLPPHNPLIPVGYYRKGSGVELVFTKFPRQRNRQIGVVGLGVGTLSVYADPSDKLKFYEINAEICRLAGTEFTFLSAAKSPVETVLGDARISLEAEPPQDFDILVLDAFTSDAIPIHLLTREAFALYKRHLKPDGVLLVNITNRHLDLQPVVEAAADQLSYQLLIVDGKRNSERGPTTDLTWAVLTDNAALKTESTLLAAARKTKPQNAVVWTDDHASLLQVLKALF